MIPVHSQYLQNPRPDLGGGVHPPFYLLGDKLGREVIVVQYVNEEAGQTALGGRALVPHHDDQLMTGNRLSVQACLGRDHTYTGSVVQPVL